MRIFRFVLRERRRPATDGGLVAGPQLGISGAFMNYTISDCDRLPPGDGNVCAGGVRWPGVGDGAPRMFRKGQTGTCH